MADEKDNFDEILDLWREGQESFFKAQSEAIEMFSKPFTQAMSDSSHQSKEPLEAWHEFINAWAPDWDPNRFMQEGVGFNKNTNVFFTMLDPANWTQYAPEQLRIILESIASGPKFADLATPHYEVASAWRETLDYQKASADMAKVLHDAWTKAYVNYNEAYTIDDLKSGDVEEAMNAWLKLANAELLETQRSPQYLDAQKRMIRASTEIKARQKELAEAWSLEWQIPTRTETDDLARTVYALRREVRQLKRELAAMKEAKK